MGCGRRGDRNSGDYRLPASKGVCQATRCGESVDNGVLGFVVSSRTEVLLRCAGGSCGCWKALLDEAGCSATHVNAIE